MTQSQSQRPMTTHRMPRNAQTVPIDRQGRSDSINQVFGDVAFHLEMRCPRGLRGVNIETSTLPHVVAFIVRDPFATRRGIRRDKSQTSLCRIALNARLDGHIFFGAGEAGQEHQPCQGFPRTQAISLRRQKYRDAHGRTRRCTVVLQRQLPPAKAAAFTHNLHRVSQNSMTERMDLPSCIRSKASLI